jgi:hypothetical protein
MTLCDGNIIANSTFSLWGAYLNTKNSMVIAPYKWTTWQNTGLMNIMDVDGWKIIDNI